MPRPPRPREIEQHNRAPGIVEKKTENNPEARFYIDFCIEKNLVLPFFVLHSPEDLESIETSIDHSLGLKRAIEQGFIDHWIIIWTKGAYPRFPIDIRLFSPHGHDRWRQLLGRKLVSELQKLRDI